MYRPTSLALAGLQERQDATMSQFAPKPNVFSMKATIVALWLLFIAPTHMLLRASLLPIAKRLACRSSHIFRTKRLHLSGRHCGFIAFANDQLYSGMYFAVVNWAFAKPIGPACTASIDFDQLID
jgi:hypothetical protein